MAMPPLGPPTDPPPPIEPFIPEGKESKSIPFKFKLYFFLFLLVVALFLYSLTK